MKGLLLIVNPVAGTKKTIKFLAEIISVFNRADFDVHVYITDVKHDASSAVRLYGDKADLIVCCGGDGTLNETINGVMQTGVQIPIGYIPAGSTNDFASSLGLPGDVVEAALQIVNGEPRAYDIGLFNSRYFSYVASFGAFTKTSYNTPQNIKNMLGHMAYLLEGIQELSKIKKEHICLETEKDMLEDDYLFGAVCNSTSIGGILTLRQELVDLGDGKFEILLVRAPKSIQEVHECVLALKSQEYNCGMITFCSASTISVTSDSEMIWSLDGERMEAGNKILIENMHKRITLIH